MPSHQDGPTLARAELEAARRLHRDTFRFLRDRLLDREIELVGLKYLARTEAGLDDQIADRQALCKGLRREVARQLTILATLGLAVWAREEKRVLLREVLIARCAAWASVAKVRAEMEAEDALAARLEVDVLAN